MVSLSDPALKLIELFPITFGRIFERNQKTERDAAKE